MHKLDTTHPTLCIYSVSRKHFSRQFLFRELTFKKSVQHICEAPLSRIVEPPHTNYVLRAWAMGSKGTVAKGF